MDEYPRPQRSVMMGSVSGSMREQLSSRWVEKQEVLDHDMRDVILEWRSRAQPVDV